MNSLLQTSASSLLAIFSVSASLSAQNYPHTDPANTQNWVLVANMSDEFDSYDARYPTGVNEDKWQICGRNGIYWGQGGGGAGFTGRGYPSNGFDTGWEFSPSNVRVESGLLKITTKYEPAYSWVNNPNGYNFEYTTGGVWSKETFNQGYMEIRCKLADAHTTGAFWTTGSGAELDVFEAIGRHASRTDLMWSSVHDWTFPTEPNNAWTDTKAIATDFGAAFYVYSAEWDELGVKIYANGVLIHEVTKAQVESGTYLNGSNITSINWPLNGGQHVWADSEIFPWWAESAVNLPADFEVDYIRVWQKSSNDAPEFTTDPVIKNTATEGVAFTASLAGDATDADSDPITFSKVSGPGWLTVAANGALSGMPSLGNVGTNAFTVQASALGGSDIAALEVVVNPGPWSNFISSHGLSGVRTNDFDMDAWNDWREYIFGGDPSDSGVVGVEPSLDYPNGKYTVTLRNDAALTAQVYTNTSLNPATWMPHETIDVTANDGGLGTYVSTIPTSSDQLFVKLEVEDTTPVNAPPTFISEPLNKANGKAADLYVGSIAADASDPEGDPLSYSKQGGPAWLTVASDGALSGIPSLGDVGANAFTVQVDAIGGFDQAVMNILVTAGWTEIDFEDFESGWGIWNDGGNDSRLLNDAQFAHSGTYSAEIRDDEVIAHITTNNINLSAYSELRIEFFYVSESLSNGEGFDLKVRDHNTGTFITVATFRHGTDFNNSVFAAGTIIVPNTLVNFGSTNQIRLESESNLNLDHVYLDDITISGR
ncbi:MAG: putative Ig domain-containing protein [Opitutaceae bacterium]